MKNTFFEYYILSDKERINNIWNDAIIVLDANVLLNLYRYTEEAKDNLLDVLEYYKDRLWIPYQVGWEYHQNRESVCERITTAYDQIRKNLNTETEDFIKWLSNNYERYACLRIKQFKDQIEISIKALCDQFLTIKPEYPTQTTMSEIYKRVSMIYEGKVGDDFDDQQLNKIYEDGKKRYNEKIPPGYRDAKNKKDKGDRHLYGDLILWKQVIKEASEKRCNVILVTDDVKEDWYERVNGQSKGARKELIREFRDETQMDILIYPCDRFLEFAKENMSVPVNKETISEVSGIRKEDEARKNQMAYSQYINYVTKLFSENPWISSDTFLQSCQNPILKPSAATSLYSDIHGKDYMNPQESIAKLMSTNPELFSNNAMNPVEGLATATAKYSDILGKDYINPIENIVILMSTHPEIFSNRAMNPVNGLATATAKYSDIFGKDYINPLKTNDQSRNH